MNICLYGASSNAISESYITATEQLGARIASRGHTLVYGGGTFGLMGAAARGMLRNNGKIIGIAPSFFEVDGVLFKECTEFIYTSTMRERKEIMENKSDAFVMTPGGPGTLDEFFEILTLKQLGQHKKPIAVFNIEGYFNPLIEMLKTIAEKKFMSTDCLKLCVFFDNPDSLIDYLENYTGDNIDVAKLKYLEQKILNDKT